MSTIITKNSANSGSTPASLVQGELAINVTDGRLFYGSGSGNVVKEFTGSASGGTIDTGSFATTGSNTFIGNQTISGTLYQSGTFYPDQIDWFSSSIGYDTGSYILTTTANGLTTYANYQDVATIINSGLLTTSSFNAYTGSSTSQFEGTASFATNALSASYAISASYEINYETSSSYADFAVSASHAAQADNAAAIDIFSFSSPVDSYLLMSNVIATTGVAVGGDTDLRYNSSTNTLTAVNISATSLTGSLLGTASYAATALSSSYADFAVSASHALTASFVTASSVYGPYGSNSVISASYALTASSALNAQDILIRVLNQSGNSITKGLVVHITSSGNSSDIPRIITASYENDNNSANTLGIANETIANGAEGFIMTEGVLKGIDTSAFISGQLIYLGPTGSIIGHAPVAPLHAVRLGQVVRVQSNNGSIYVRIDNGYELDELHNVLINTSSISYGDLLMYSSSLWINSKQLSGSYGLTGSLTISGSSTFINIGPAIFSGSVTSTDGFTGSLLGTATTASYVLQAVSASFSTTASYYGGSVTSASYALTATSASHALNANNAITASYVLNAVSASFASTASSVNTLNQNVLITGSLTVGAATAGVSENTLTLGPRDNGSEGGQLMLQAPGGTYTSASMWDNYANLTRLLRGSNAGSDAVVASFNMHTKQMQLPAYNSVSAFPGSPAAFLAVDSSGNLITTSSAGGGGGGVTINNNVDNYVITATGTINTLNGESNMQFNGSSLTITGEITSSGAIRSTANGAMYFRGGDDAEFWDINVANTVGIYGQQDATVASIKLGSGGGVISGKIGNIGIGTINPTANLDVIGSTHITGSLGVTGSFSTQTFDGLTYVPAISISDFSRTIYDVMGTSSFDADARDLYDSTTVNSISWESRRLTDGLGSTSINWDTRWLVDPLGITTVRWGIRTGYDSSTSQSIDWGGRILYDANESYSIDWAAKALWGTGGFPTLEWASKYLNDASGNISVDWGNRLTKDSSNKESINYQNRQLKNSNGNEVLNWQSGVTITGSAIVSGSFESTGSLKIQGAGTGFAGPFIAIEVDDANFSRKLYDYNAGIASIDFGNRTLFTSNNTPAISWDGSAGVYNTNLYNSQTIDSATRGNLYGFNQQGGQILAESYFDVVVMDNDLVYLNTDGQWYQVDQTTDSSTKMLGIAKNVFSQTGSVFIEGDIVVSTGPGYPIVANAGYGLPVYIRQGAGTIMDTSIPASGYVRLLGYCYYTPYAGSTEWIMKFRPSNEWIVL